MITLTDTGSKKPLAAVQGGWSLGVAGLRNVSFSIQLKNS